MSTKTWIRQDRIFWEDEMSGAVRYKDPDTGTEERGNVDDFTVWAPVSTNTLSNKLGQAFEETGPRTIAHAIRDWHEAKDANVAIYYLDEVDRDIERLRVLDWHYPPTHGYSFNARGPSASRFFSTKGDNLGTTTPNMQAFAATVTMVGRSYGGAGGAGWYIETRIEDIPEYLHSLSDDIMHLKTCIDDLRDVSAVTEAMLSEKWRVRCKAPGCGRWVALERSNTEYCDQRCKQRAYRRRLSG